MVIQIYFTLNERLVNSLFKTQREFQINASSMAISAKRIWDSMSISQSEAALPNQLSLIPQIFGFSMCIFKFFQLWRNSKDRWCLLYKSCRIQNLESSNWIKEWLETDCHMNQMSKMAKKIVVFSTTKSDDTGVVHTQVQTRTNQFADTFVRPCPRTWTRNNLKWRTLTRIPT